MKKRLLSLFTVVTLVLAMCSLSVFAAASIDLDAIDDVNQNQYFQIKGEVTGDLTAVIYKIMNPAGMVMDMGNMSVAAFNGNGLSKQALSSIYAPGTYKLQVGYDDVVDEISFVVLQATSSGGYTPPGSNSPYMPKGSTDSSTSGDQSVTNPDGTVTNPDGTVTNPDGSVVIPPATSVNSFTDIPADFDWAKSSIDILVKAGVINGTTGITFEPARSITRAEFTKIMVAAFGFENAVGESMSFTDVSASDWFYSFVIAGVKAGLVQGYPEGDFRPDQTITREEMAAILIRTFTKLGMDIDPAELTFADADEVGDWAKADVAALANLGIVQGRGENMFAPKAELTRAEAARVVDLSLTAASPLLAFDEDEVADEVDEAEEADDDVEDVEDEADEDDAE